MFMVFYMDPAHRRVFARAFLVLALIGVAVLILA